MIETETLSLQNSDARKIAESKIQTLRSAVPNSNIGVDLHPKESPHEHNNKRMIKIPRGQKPRRSDAGGVTFERLKGSHQQTNASRCFPLVLT